MQNSPNYDVSARSVHTVKSSFFGLGKTCYYTLKKYDATQHNTESIYYTLYVASIHLSLDEC